MALNVLTYDGVLYLWQKIKSKFSTKAETITSIQRSGTTFTVTFADGSTTTFDQQDTTYDAATATPAMDGTGAVGSSVKYAREDHVHPSDTSKISASEKGSANGVCPLDGSGLVSSTYLPSYVDDVIEAYGRTGVTELSSTWLSKTGASGEALTPETGKVYVLMADTTNYSANSQFRWGGSTYVQLYDGGITSITNADIDTIVDS